VVSSFASSEDSDILPHESWIHVPLVSFSLCQFYQQGVIAFVDKFQLRFDGSYLVGTETSTIVEAVTQAIFFLDGRHKDIFACRVPPFAFPIDDEGSYHASMHNCFAEILI
jgi:hypothetical protein